MFLRQSTASQEVLLGPFLGDTDGKTAETGLTIANTDIKIWKSGATTEANKNSGGATHIASGRYYAVLDATDTDTVGMIEINVAVSGALPVQKRLVVLEEAVFDAMFAAGAVGPNTAAPLDAAGTRTALGLASANLDTQLADLPTVAEFEARTILAADYLIVGDMPANFAGLGINASGHIERVVLVDTTTTNTDMRGTDGANTATPLDAAGTRSAVGLASANLDAQLSTIDSVADGIATEVGKIPRGTAAVDAGPFTMKVTDGAAITGGQSVTAEYE